MIASMTHASDWEPPDGFDVFDLTDEDCEKLGAVAGADPPKTPLKVKVGRVDPNNSQRAPMLPATFQFLTVTQEEITKTYGGGYFEIKIYDKAHKYVMSRRVEYPGAPILTEAELEGLQMPIAANFPPGPTPEQRNPAAAWRMPMFPQQGQPAPAPVGPTAAELDFDRRLTRMESSLERALNAFTQAAKPPPPPPPAPAPAPAANDLLTTRVIEQMRGQNQQLARLSNPSTQPIPAPPAGAGLPPGTLNLSLSQLVDLGKLAMAFGGDKDKPNEFLNETLPGILEQASPLIAVAMTALTKDEATKKALIDAAERAATAMAHNAETADE